jgi:glycosyltransferase involved in cell wall biosynthesis
MNIVFIGSFGLRPKSTMSVRALSLAKALVRRGHQLTLLIPPWDDPGRAGQSWQDEGVRVVNLGLPPRVPLLFHLLLTRNLVGQALVLRPDVIHFFKPKAYAGLAHWTLWWLRRLGWISTRLVVDEDDWEQAWNDILPYSGWQKRLFTWQEKWGLRRADGVTVASRALEELVTVYRPPEQAGVHYIPNGYLPAERDEPGRDAGLTPQAVREKWQLGTAPVILLYTRFAEFRLERVVKLIGQVAERCPEARWLIVGQGLQRQEQALAEQLAQAGLAGYARFTGWPVEQISAYFAVGDVAVFPYDDTVINRTKCSVKLIDLLAAGLPVVADGVGQNCEYIRHNISGVLVPPQDDTAFCEVIVDLLQAPEKRRRLSQEAVSYLRDNFNWLSLAQIVERVYR